MNREEKLEYWSFVQAKAHELQAKGANIPADVITKLDDLVMGFRLDVEILDMGSMGIPSTPESDRLSGAVERLLDTYDS